MRASHDLSRVSITFDESNLVLSAELSPAAALAQRVGLAELVEGRLPSRRHGASGGTKALSVIGAVLAGADSIDDTDVLPAGRWGEVFTDVRARRRWGAGYGPSSGTTCASSTRSPGAAQPAPGGRGHSRTSAR